MVLGVLAVLVFGLLLVFRQEISKKLSFSSVAEKEETLILSELPAREKEPEPKQGPVKIYSVTNEKPKISSYSGRDPAEIRPIAEEVKLFTEDQKRQLYATLEMHGRAVKADPSYFNGWIQVGLLKKTIGDFVGARDAWEYAGVIQPLNSTSFANLGELYWHYLQDYLKAEENFKISIKNKPTDPLTYISLAELYHYSYTAKADLADDVLLEGLKENSEAEGLMRRLAYLYEQRKENAEALAWWQKVLTLEPDDQSVIQSIERLKNK